MDTGYGERSDWVLLRIDSRAGVGEGDWRMGMYEKDRGRVGHADRGRAARSGQFLGYGTNMAREGHGSGMGASGNVHKEGNGALCATACRVSTCLEPACIGGCAYDRLYTYMVIVLECST